MKTHNLFTVHTFYLTVMLLTSLALSPAAFAQKPMVSIVNGGDAAEPSTNGTFEVTIDRSRILDTEVFYIVNGTATAGADYVPLSGSIFLPAGEVPTAYIDIFVIDDAEAEPDETVIITLTATDTGTVEIDSFNETATVAISSDDSDDATLTLVKVVINDDGGTASYFDFILTASGPDSISGISGDSSITGATVAAGDYFLSESGGPSGYFSSGWICDNGSLVGETLTLAPGEYVTCTVTNNDIPVESGTLSIDPVSISIDEDAGTASVNVVRINGSGGEVSVDYNTADGTAVAGADYGSADGTLYWVDGDTDDKTISIPITNDTEPENTEEFTVIISAPTGGASLGNTTGAVTIFDDDPEEPVEVNINQFFASPSVIPEGDVVTLHWNTDGATQCFGEEGVAAWLGEKDLTSNKALVLEAAGMNVFRLTCTNTSGGHASRTTTVEVQGSNPDLALESLTLSHSEVSTGAVVTATADFRNSGDATSPSSPVTWYLSTNEAISESDEVIDTDELGALNAGSYATESSTITAPAVAGEYWIGVCAEPVEGEPDIINNCSAGVPLSVLSAAVCDITSLACGSTTSGSLNESDCQSGPLGPGHFAAGRTFTGSKGQSVILEAGWGNGDGFLALQSPPGEIVITNDDFGDSKHSKIEYELQRDGTFTIWLTTFESGVMPTFDLSLFCPEPTEPNLTVALTQGPPDELKVGELFGVECSIDNIGNGHADATTLRYMLSTNSTVSPDDIELGAFDISSLSPDAGTLENWETELFSPGEYWFGACIDSVEGESLRGNNCTRGQRVSVRAAADCSTIQLELGQTVSSDISSSDCDQSPRGVAYSSKAFVFEGSRKERIRVDAQWHSFDGYIYLAGSDGKVIASNDDDGDSSGSSLIEVELLESGQHTIWATSYSPEISGSFELNAGVVTQCTGGELTVQSIVADKNLVSDGEQVTVSAQISASPDCAQSVASKQSLPENHLASNPKVNAEDTSQNSQLRYFLSTNSKITSGDAEVGKDVIDSIQAGGSGQEHLLVEAPVTSGQYWVGACIDKIDDDCVVSDPIEVQSDVESIAFNSGINDAWWDSSKPGQGILISVFPSSKFIFMAWFTFDTELPPEEVQANLGDPSQRRMTAYGFYEGNNATLDIEMTSGGVFNSNNPPVTQVNDGTVQIQFTDCNVGRVIYDIPTIDQQGTVEIERVTRENLHLCEAALTDTQQLQDAIRIEADPALLKTGAGTVLSWQAPAGMHCVSTGGSGRWAEGMELKNTGSRKLRIATEGKHKFGMNCSDGFAETNNISASTDVIAINVDDNDTEKTVQKVLFNPGLNDAWFDPNTPGQGILLTVFPDSEFIFLAWFTFDTERPAEDVPSNLGDPGHRWMTAYGFYDGSKAALKLELTKDGIFDSTEPVPSQEDYGTLDLSFDHCNSGQMTYNIPSAGITGTIPLQRGALDKVPECQALDGIDDPIDSLQQPQQKELLPNRCGSTYTWDFAWEAQNGYSNYQIEIRNGRSNEPVFRKTVTDTELHLQKNEAITNDYLTGWRWRVRGFPSFASAGGSVGPWSDEWEFEVAPLNACN